MKNVLLLLFFTGTISVFSQVTGTVILVRHAEKDTVSNDPELSKPGIQRSLKLSKMLSNYRLHAIFSTNYNRTRQTVQPLAAIHKLKISYYEATDKQFIIDYLRENPGHCTIISGHSNTIPRIFNFLTSSDIPDFKDSEYDNLIIIHLLPDQEPFVDWLKY